MAIGYPNKDPNAKPGKGKPVTGPRTGTVGQGRKPKPKP